MTEFIHDASVRDAANLLTHYSFDLGSYTAEQLIDHWLRHYPPGWLRLAVIEALYQGRYKAISVEQILNMWRRRSQSHYHFNHEFERMVCGRLPQNLALHPYERGQQDKYQAGVPTRVEVIASASGSSDEGDLPTAALEAEPGNSSDGDAPIDRSIPSQSPFPAETATANASEDPVQFDLPPDYALSSISTHGAEDPPAIRPYQPGPDADADMDELALWAQGQVMQHPIHQFIPTAGFSGFYVKLRAVAHDDPATLALSGEHGGEAERAD